jgi:hypothetical protein
MAKKKVIKHSRYHYSTDSKNHVLSIDKEQAFIKSIKPEHVAQVRVFKTEERLDLCAGEWYVNPAHVDEVAEKRGCKDFPGKIPHEQIQKNLYMITLLLEILQNDPRTTVGYGYIMHRDYRDGLHPSGCPHVVVYLCKSAMI